MSSLILDSLEIRNFRLFRHLCIERLGRVNLIVGKNGVGKTCLLEAVRTYARIAEPSTVVNLLFARNEIASRFTGSSTEEADGFVEGLKNLFYGRTIQDTTTPASVGPVKSPYRSLSLAIETFKVPVQLQLPLFAEAPIEDSFQALSVQMGTQDPLLYPLERFGRRVWPPGRAEPTRTTCVFIPADGLDSEEISTLWDQIALTDLEESVLDALRILLPDVQRVSLVATRKGGRGRFPAARLEGPVDRLPLRSLGEGMNRVFGIALSLVNAKDGFLLIDEVESGLHYSAQSSLWRLVFESARQLNVQVFATTHSWDCVAAFQQAAQEDQQEEGMLIRLENRRGEIVPILIDERQLAIATREQIEIR